MRILNIICSTNQQENFGITEVEVLACSLPVLTSNKIDIFNEIVKDKAGIIADDSLDVGTYKMLSQLHNNLTSKGKQIMRAHAMNCYESRFELHSASATWQLLELLDTNSA